MNNNNCETCQFFELKTVTVGECKRYPPTRKPGEYERAINRYEWPFVYIGGWCGEYRQKEVLDKSSEDVVE